MLSSWALLNYYLYVYINNKFYNIRTHDEHITRYENTIQFQNEFKKKKKEVYVNISDILPIKNEIT